MKLILKIFRNLLNKSPRYNYGLVKKQFKYFLMGNNNPDFDYSLDFIINNKKHMNRNYLIDRWERYKKVINVKENIDMESNFSFQGKKILELGCGPLYGWGPIALYLGSEEYYYLEPALRRKTIQSQK